MSADERERTPSETVHDLKTWPDYFDAILRGTKTFEVRREVDRYFHIGDTLRLREWHPNSETYTGRSIDVAVTHIFRGAAAFLAEFPPRVAVLGIRPIGQPMADVSPALDASLRAFIRTVRRTGGNNEGNDLGWNAALAAVEEYLDKCTPHPQTTEKK